MIAPVVGTGKARKLRSETVVAIEAIVLSENIGDLVCGFVGMAREA